MGSCGSDCPTGKSSNCLSSPFRKNIFVFLRRKSLHRPCYPAPARGAYRDRHGRWARDAMDAAVSGGRIARQTNGTVADGEVAWS
jgi:hypothetical protein